MRDRRDVRFLVGTSRQNSWREHKHAAIRVSALHKGPAIAAAAAAVDGSKCRGSFTFRYPVDGNRAAARLSFLYIFFSSLSLSLSPSLFLFSFIHLDTRRALARVVFSLRKVLFPTAQFFLRVETKQLYETNASGRPCPGKGRPPRDQRGRDQEETLTRTKNRCTWSFRLHASRAHFSSSFVIKRRICARRAAEFRSSPPPPLLSLGSSPKSMHACRAYHSRARGNIREGNIRNGLSRKIAGFHSPSLVARIFPRRKFHVVCHCEIMQKLNISAALQ